MARTCLVPLVLLLVAGTARADDDLPLDAGKDFSGAHGRYRINIRATPTRLRVEDSVILRVRITGDSADKKPPQRLDGRVKLVKFDELPKEFQVEELPDRDRHPNDRTWDFFFRLRPRQVKVSKIPRLGFNYYDPSDQSYQTSYPPKAIPLVVTPRPQADRVEETVETGKRLSQKYPLATGPAVLERQESSELPPPWLLGLLVALPPGLCLAWYGLWRHYYPDALRVVTLRRSRAARQALKRLRAMRLPDDPAESGARAAEVVAQYLRQRLDFQAAEPTPYEILLQLEQAGVSGELAERFADFFRSCDAIRFGPISEGHRDNLGKEAGALVRRLEGELC